MSNLIYSWKCLTSMTILKYDAVFTKKVMQPWLLFWYFLKDLIPDSCRIYDGVSFCPQLFNAKKLVRIKCLYWLYKEWIAYTRKYESLLLPAKLLGFGYLKHLHVAENAKYTSETFLQEMLASLVFTLWKNIYKEINQSPLFCLMLDETADV